MSLFSRHSDSKSIRCPECGEEQRVQKGVLSLYCKRCKNRISVSGENRTAVTSAKPAAFIPDKIEVDCPLCGWKNDAAADAMSLFCKKCHGLISVKKSASALNPIESISGKTETRTITCYYCNTAQEVPLSAMSAFCSNCRQRIDLADVEIAEEYNEKIFTRGRLHVLQRGKVNAEMNVMSTKIDGEVRGDVYAEDKVTIGRTGKVFGNITARKMEMEPGAFYSGTVRLNADIIKNTEKEQQ